MSWLFGVSRWTIYRRVQSYGFQSTANFSLLPDTELDVLVLEYMGRHGLTTGRTYLAGYLKSLGLRIQRRNIRDCLARVDPASTPCHGKILCGIWMAITPSVRGQLDEDANDLEFYGVDPDGPSPFEDSNNNVVLPPVTLPVEHQSVQTKVLARIDLLMPSMQMGIAIYTNIHQIVKESVEHS